MKKKISLLALGSALCLMLTACGSKFDASAYLQAMLDLSYKNNSEAYVEMGLGTAENAAAVYESGIDSEMSYFDEKFTLSDEQESDFRELFKELYQKADYTVGNAEKQEDGSYIVQVSYRKLLVFENAMALYYESIEALPEQWESLEDTPTDEEMLSDMADALRDALRTGIENAGYGDEETLTVTIELVDNMYTPNSDDVTALELALFDSDFGSAAAEE